LETLSPGCRPNPRQSSSTWPWRSLRHSPAHPRYGGVDGDEIVPHLTIADGAQLEVMQQAAHEVASALPIEARIEAVTLLVGGRRPNSWRVRDVFRLQ